MSKNLRTREGRFMKTGFNAKDVKSYSRNENTVPQHFGIHSAHCCVTTLLLIITYLFLLSSGTTIDIVPINFIYTNSFILTETL